ncbi:uncharacterized protein CEXT_409801 [Caerostris extrusa]|uniref:Uncharacterized protein n=1 Tax=Caerostris extrusa TaxID=172846 RepID=A0AAV4MR90_CAEEX|nr:uncharacterized protein CEXT_409801 [Caerostris extrusa]
MWIADNPNDVYKQLRVICEKPPPKRALACQPTKKPCLFNITDDPCEYMDLADQYPDEVNSMLARVAKYKEESMEPQSKSCDVSGDPMCHDFLCVPWLDPEHRTECDYASGSVYTDEVDITNSRPPGLSSRNNANFILIYTQFLFIIFLSKLFL